MGTGMWSLMVVPLIVWVGVVIYLVRLDLRLSRMESAGKEADL